MGNRERVPCDRCGGTGSQELSRESCCGNLTASGDCRAYCAIPEFYYEECGECGGEGSHEIAQAIEAEKGGDK